MKGIRLFFTMTCLIPLVALGQGLTIRGKVTNISDGKPLVGVSINAFTPNGREIGATSDSNGAYTIQTSAAATYLIFQYVGMQSAREAINNRSVINVVLSPEESNLDEVVVVGYGTQKKETLTGSVATLKSEQITTTKNESVVNSLTGKVPGLRVVQRTAEPGGYENDLNIRGFKSAPLVVIDGVPSGGFERMDPNEIESVSVLKDAAASIYGVRASGGVILITTKKGSKNGKVDFSYSVNQSWQTFLGMPEGVDAVDYMILHNEKRKRDLANNFIANTTPAWSNADMEPYLNGTYPSADWIGAAFKKSSPQIQHNLNMNGGNEKINYFFNLGYMKQDGVYKSDDLNYNRWNFRSNVTVNITKGLEAQALVSGVMDEKHQPYQDLWTIFKYTWLSVPRDQIYANNNPLYPSAEIRDNANPVAITNSDMVGSKTFKNKNFNGQLSLKYDIPGIKGLNARAMYNFAYSVGDNTEHRKEYTLYRYNAENETYEPQNVNGPSRIRRAYYPAQSSLAQLALNYDNVFLNDHHVAATLVYEQSHNETDNFYAQRNVALPIDYLFGGLVDGDQLGYMDANGLTDIATRAIVGRVNYDYKGKYLAEFLFRRDGSNKYMPGSDQWGFFPGASVGWRISQEPFLRKLISEETLTDLKIRASYGKTGDEGGSPFNYINGFNYPQPGYNFGAGYVNGSTIRIGNPGLSWAVNTKKNLAADFSFWKGKFDATVEVFRSDRTGLAARPNGVVPGTVGAVLPEVNMNSDRVQGMDVILTYRGKVNDLSFNVTGNIGTTRAQTRFVDESRAGNEYQQWRNSQRNRYQNIWWGKTYAGQFTGYDQIYNHPINTGGGNNSVIPGDYYYEDWNEDGVIDAKDEHPIATNDIPLVNFGLNLGVTYKGFDLSMLLQGAAGVYVQYDEQYAEPLMYDYGSALTRFLDRWHTLNPTDNVFDPHTQWVSGYYPAMGSPNAEGTKAVQNGSYLRIKTLELGYSIPTTALQKIGIKRLRIYVNSYNLATFSGLQDYDPEHPGKKQDADFEYGLGGYKYPMNRTFNLGANISF